MKTQLRCLRGVLWSGFSAFRIEKTIEASLHPLQDKRLKALRQFEILDTPREEAFDSIVALAAAICDTPISVVNMIDRERQWFKAEIGLGVRETPLDTSICSHVILEKDFVEIPNTLEDPRMRDNPLCLADPGLRFYAGALLKTSDGLPIGTLCVLDNQPRTLTPLQRQTIHVLAEQVMSQLELRLSLRRLEMLRREIDHRVKNSLQAVSSLIRLQRNQLRDSGGLEALDAIARRVNSIALLHEELCHAGADERISLQDYLSNIVKLLQQNLPKNIVLRSDIEDIDAPTDQAAGIAIIISEFVANSAKHAFPDHRDGEIIISGATMDQEVFVVTCADTGVGRATTHVEADELEQQKSNGSGLGLRIVRATADQIGAVIQEELTACGFKISLTTPLHKLGL